MKNCKSWIYDKETDGYKWFICNKVAMVDSTNYEKCTHVIFCKYYEEEEESGCLVDSDNQVELLNKLLNKITHRIDQLEHRFYEALQLNTVQLEKIKKIIGDITDE